MPEPQYFYAQADHQRGPVGAAELISMQLPPSTLVWREGMRQWERLDSVAELAAANTVNSAGPTAAPIPPTPPPMYGPAQTANFATPVGSGNAPPFDSSKRIVAGVFAIVMGSLGIHKFILGYTTAGLIMCLVTIFTCGYGGLIFFPIGIAEGIIYLSKSDEDFYRTYVLNKREWF